MRQGLAATALVILGLSTACGDASNGGVVDRASTFTGSWTGSTTTQVGPAECPPGAACLTSTLTALTSSLTITSSALNALALDQPCAGLPASVASDSSFAVGPFSCAPVANPGCGTATVMDIDGGSGTFANGVLMISVTGTITNCGQVAAFLSTFSGSQQ